jgi:hypothetical protein
MGMRAILKEFLPEMFDQIGEDATYTPSGGSPVVACKIFIDFDVMLQPSGMEAQVVQVGTMIEALLLDDENIGIGTTEPSRGDKFTYDGTVYTVQAIEKNDGLTVKMVVT